MSDLEGKIMPEEQNKNPNPKYLWLVLIAAIFVVGIIFMFAKYQRPSDSGSESWTEAAKPKEKSAFVKKFSSEQEFKYYLEKAKNVSGTYGGRGGGLGLEAATMKSNDGASMPLSTSQGDQPARVSETNVQVAGIDEPDAVKTDGKEIYFSVPRPEIMPMDDTVGRSDESKELFPLQQTGGTKAIKAFPLDDLKIDSRIEKSGNLILTQKTLVVIPSEEYPWSQNSGKIQAYDVSNPEKPKESWNIELKKSTLIAGARLRGGKIYLVTKTETSSDDPCLLKPFSVNGKEFSFSCLDVYHPEKVVPSDAVFTAMIVSPESGAVEKSISFLGANSYDSSTVYMSEKALYLTYYNPGDAAAMLHSFFEENKDLAPDWLIQKLKNLQDYDISSSAKMTEIWELIGRYQNSLSDDDRLKMQNEMTNRVGDYLKKHRRDLDSTGIVKISSDNLGIDSTGSVPGRLLSQFSLDEYKGDLRAATTVGENFLGWGFGFRGNTAESTANDVYILGDGLKTEGSVIDLGRGEQIYAVRFIEDKGYVVTFKQIDPFYVLDLSDPVNPVKKGELKIPGYSSYLHPIAKNKILGVGQESGRVKISLFDVGSPEDPEEISKYNLDEYWSEISQTHHAFLQDEKHQVFFLPGSRGGYIFSYENDALKLEKAVSDIQAKRAIYIDNFLYVIGEDKVLVLDERNWEKVNELEL